MRDIILRALYPFRDAKLEVGHSILTVQEWIRLSLNDFTVIESLMSRFGSDLDWGMVQEYFDLFQKSDRFNTLKEHYGEAK